MSDFHGVNMVGPFKIERLTSRPTWTASDVGREIYVTTADAVFGGKFWKGNQSTWVEVSDASHAHTQYVRNDIGNSFSGIQNLQDNVLLRPEIKDYSESLTVTGTTSGTIALDIENGNNFKCTASGAITFTFNNPPVSGKVGSFSLFLVGGGAYTITWPSSVVWSNGTTPTLGATTASFVDIITFFTITGGTRWYGTVAIEKLAFA